MGAVERNGSFGGLSAGARRARRGPDRARRCNASLNPALRAQRWQAILLHASHSSIRRRTCAGRVPRCVRPHLVGDGGRPEPRRGSISRGGRARARADRGRHRDAHSRGFRVGRRASCAREPGAKLLLSGEGGSDWQYRFATADGARSCATETRSTSAGAPCDVRHTPGHTPEHVSFVVTDHGGERPADRNVQRRFRVRRRRGPTRSSRARGERSRHDGRDGTSLFRSLHATDSTFPTICRSGRDTAPARRAARRSAPCRRRRSAMSESRTGHFRPTTRIVSWREVLAGQPEPPKYFATMKALNRDGPPPMPPMPSSRRSTSRRFGERSSSEGRDRRATQRGVRRRPPSRGRCPSRPARRSSPGRARCFRTTATSCSSPMTRSVARECARGCCADRSRSRHRVGRAPLARRLAAPNGTADVDHARAKQLAASRDRTVIDVRGAAEWNEAHLSNAEHLFLGDLAAQTATIPRDLRSPCTVRAERGRRSPRAFCRRRDSPTSRT